MLGSRRGWVALLVCVPLWAAGSVAAQAESAADHDAGVEEARRLFAEGLAFVEDEDWVQAEERFRRVLALRSSHVVAYNLASALSNLGHPVEAAELLRSILRASDVDAPTRDAAQQLLLATEPRIGTLTIRVSGDLTGVRFALDDKPLELSAQVHTISVDPGEHSVTAHREQTPLAFERVMIGGGAPLQVELAVELPAQLARDRVVAPVRAGPRPAPVAATAPEPQPALEEPARSGPGVWLWAAGGAALATAAAVITVVLVSGGGEAMPVAGDTDPPFVRGRVE
jgi:hypothetical protein